RRPDAAGGDRPLRAALAAARLPVVGRAAAQAISEIPNPKSEIRNKSKNPNPKSETGEARGSVIWILGFGFVSDFVLRIWDFLTGLGPGPAVALSPPPCAGSGKREAMR